MSQRNKLFRRLRFIAYTIILLCIFIYAAYNGLNWAVQYYDGCEITEAQALTAMEPYIGNIVSSNARFIRSDVSAQMLSNYTNFMGGQPENDRMLVYEDSYDAKTIEKSVFLGCRSAQIEGISIRGDLQEWYDRLNHNLDEESARALMNELHLPIRDDYKLRRYVVSRDREYMVAEFNRYANGIRVVGDMLNVSISNSNEYQIVVHGLIPYQDDVSPTPSIREAQALELANQYIKSRGEVRIYPFDSNKSIINSSVIGKHLSTNLVMYPVIHNKWLRKVTPNSFDLGIAFMYADNESMLAWEIVYERLDYNPDVNSLNIENELTVYVVVHNGEVFFY